MIQNNNGKIKYSMHIGSPQINIEDAAKNFEKVIIGKKYDKIKDFMSRIDHMISSAHSIASIQAIEDAFQISPSKKTKMLRELLLIGEIISSNTEYLYTKIFPRILNIKHFSLLCIEAKNDYKKYRLIKNNIFRYLNILGYKYPHQINFIVGGILKQPSEDEFKELIRILKDIRPEIIKITEFISKNIQKKLDLDLSHVSLWKIDSIPLINGDVMFADDRQIPFKEYFKDKIISKNVMIGPISRISNHLKLLNRVSERIAKKRGMKYPISNPYDNILCMGLEMINLIDKALEILEFQHFEKEDIIKYKIKDGIGRSCIESAKGTIYHEYKLNSLGKVKKAKIISNIAHNKHTAINAVKNLPIDHDNMTRKEIFSEIEFLLDAFYL